MGSYYYLVSQLPYLIYGQKPPMSPEAFRDFARPFLSSQDAALLDLVDLDPQPVKRADEGKASYAELSPKCGSDFIDGWREWERALRLNLARHRAIKAKREGTASVEPPNTPADAATLATRAMAAAESPLEGEILIDKARWGAIETLQGLDYFGRNTVYAYLLKLFILQRKASFQTEIGFSEYKSLYAAILEGVQMGTSPAGEYK